MISSWNVFVQKGKDKCMLFNSCGQLITSCVRSDFYSPADSGNVSAACYKSVFLTLIVLSGDELVLIWFMG